MTDDPIDVQGEARQIARLQIEAAKRLLRSDEVSAADVTASTKVMEQLAKNPLLIQDAKSFEQAQEELAALAREAEEAKKNRGTFRAVGS